MIACAVIPAYEPTTNLPRFVGSLRANGFGAVVVVDDGSRQVPSGLFAAVAAIPGCVVLHHPENRGKGAALKTGFRHVLEALPACDVVVTMDADGQHVTEDCRRVGEALARADGAACFGVRDFAWKTTPFRSWWGNRWTSLLFALFYGRWFRDTQTGLRAFRRDLLPFLAGVKGEGYAYEMAVLCHLARRGHQVEQVPIQTIYVEGNVTSHYSPLKDTLRVLGMLFLCRV